MPRSTSTTIGSARRAAIAVAILAATLSVGPAHGATATYLTAGRGIPVQGTRAGLDWHEGHVGTLLIRVDDMDPAREAYCVDFEHDLDDGDVLPQAPSDYPIEVAYIVHNAYPQPNRIAVALHDLDEEAAAVQSAIWAYTDNFVATDPPQVAWRAAQIVEAARVAARMRPAAPPHAIRIDSPSGVRRVDRDLHRASATLVDGWGRPVAGPSIEMEVTTGPSAGTSATHPAPRAELEYAASAAGIDEIEASAVYLVPTGQKFKRPDRQGFILAGDPVPGTVTATSTVSWLDCGREDHGACEHECRVPTCGDGIVQSDEQCDDGNRNDNDDCTNACRHNVCGDEIVNPWKEECDDGNSLHEDGCTDDCRLPRCGDGIRQTAEVCDDGNTTGGDGCPADCGRRDPEARLALTCEAPATFLGAGG